LQLLFSFYETLHRKAQAIADGFQKEVDVWREHGESFGYVFFLAMAR